MTARQSAGGMEVLAPAKLNLFLEVLGRRADGYHELETVMVATDLCDTLHLRDDPEGQVTLACDDPSLPTDRGNLVVRAAEALRKASGCTRGAAVTLRKAIPAQAGLAGGSSDAAATLAALDRIWGLGLGPDRLGALAGTLGSDVPFFLQGGRAAVCRGRGERVEPLDWSGRLDCVLVCPPDGLSTAEVYREWKPDGPTRPAAPLLEALASQGGARLGGLLFNRLQATAERLRPGLTRVRDALAALTPTHLDGHLMSGSGSAYFGLARGPDAARDAAARLEALGLGWVRVLTCGT